MDNMMTDSIFINSETILEREYKGNSHIKKIKIGRDVKNIGAEAFAMCSNIKSIEVDEKNEHFTSANGSNAIIDKISGLLIVGCQTTAIPKCVTEIWPFAFCGQTKLTKIVIPSTVKKIDAYAFDGCERLVEIDIKEGLEAIEDNCFRNCPNIETIILPKTLKYVLPYIFGAEYVNVDDDENVTSVCESPVLKIKDIYYGGLPEEYYDKVSLESKFKNAKDNCLTVHFGDGMFWESIPSEDLDEFI